MDRLDHSSRGWEDHEAEACGVLVVCREISQDEFLPEVTGSKRVICHFYHNDFQRCKIMDKVSPRITQLHILFYRSPVVINVLI
jgi:hypothetical protein